MSVCKASRPALVLYFNGSFVGRCNGAHVRMWDQLIWFSRHFESVAMYSFADHPDYPWRPCDVAEFKAKFPTVELVLDTRSWSLRLARRLKNVAMTLAPLVGRHILQWRIAGATPGYAALLRRDPQIFIVNYVDALAELNGVTPARCIMETHDIKFLTHIKGRGGALGQLRTLGKLRSELCTLELLNGLIAIAPGEAGLFKLLYADKPVWYVPQYTGPRTVERRAATADFDLLFVGSENMFNVEGLTRLLTKASWISRYTVGVAGRVCEAKEVKRLAAAYPNLQLLGFVDDIQGLYARCKVVISPVDGTGLKIKAVEALTAGKPVLASAHTMDGLPAGFEACVFPLQPEPARDLITRADLLAAASQSAACYAATLAETGDALKLKAYITECLSESFKPEAAVFDS